MAVHYNMDYTVPKYIVVLVYSTVFPMPDQENLELVAFLSLIREMNILIFEKFLGLMI